MQPRGVDAGCMVFAITCNLHSVGRKGPENELVYFLRNIHAHVPTACVILVRLITMGLPIGNDKPNTHDTRHMQLICSYKGVTCIDMFLTPEPHS